jgi:Rod binding domain-containing protein
MKVELLNSTEAGKLYEAASGLEAFVVSILLRAMRKTIKKTLFSGGRGEEIFQKMLDDKLAELVSRKEGGLGIGKLIFDKFSRFLPTEGTKSKRGDRNIQGLPGDHTGAFRVFYNDR